MCTAIKEMVRQGVRQGEDSTRSEIAVNMLCAGFTDKQNAAACGITEDQLATIKKEKMQMD